MKKSLMLIAALALFDATPVRAAKGDVWIGLQLGGVVPTGERSNSAESGFEAGLAGTYFHSEHVGVGVDVAYQVMKGFDEANAATVAFFGPGSEYRLNAIQVSAHMLYDFRASGMVRPYAKGGLGLYFMKPKLVTPFGNFDETAYEFGYVAGAGVNFDLGSGFDIGLGGTYHRIQSSETAANHLAVGVSLIWGVGVR